MMRSTLQDFVASITLCSIGGVVVVICISLNSFQNWYRYGNHTAYTITHVFFYIGLFIFFLGLLTLLRLIIRRRTTNFRGVVIGRNPASTVTQQTTVVMSTVLPSNCYQQNPPPYPQQQYTTQQTTHVNEFYPPQAPPAYSVK